MVEDKGIDPRSRKQRLQPGQTDYIIRAKQFLHQTPFDGEARGVRPGGS